MEQVRYLSFINKKNGTGVITQSSFKLAWRSGGFAIISGRKIKCWLFYFCLTICRSSIKSRCGYFMPCLGFFYGILVLIIYAIFVFSGLPPHSTICTFAARSIISSMNLHFAMEKPILLRCL